MPSKIDGVIGRANQLIADGPMELGEFMRRNFEQVQAWVDEQKPELPDWRVFSQAVFLELGIGIAGPDGQKREHRTDTVRRTWNRSREILAKRAAKAAKRNERAPLLPGMSGPRIRPVPEAPRLAMEPEAPPPNPVTFRPATKLHPVPTEPRDDLEPARQRFRPVSLTKPATSPENPNEEK